MKKILAVALAFLLGAFALTGCAGGSDPYTEKSYTSDTQIRGVSLDVRDREIEVTLSEDDAVHIQYFENSRESYAISVSDDNVLTMESVSTKGWTDFIGGKPAAANRKIVLAVPDRLLDSLTLSTTNEDISLPTLSVAGTADLASNGGNIHFDSLDVGSALTLTVKNGNISGVVAGSYDDFAIRTSVKKGDSNLPADKEGGDKTLTVSANNGNVDVTFQK